MQAQYATFFGWEYTYPIHLSVPFTPITCAQLTHAHLVLCLASPVRRPIGICASVMTQAMVRLQVVDQSVHV